MYYVVRFRVVSRMPICFGRIIEQLEASSLLADFTSVSQPPPQNAEEEFPKRHAEFTAVKSQKQDCPRETNRQKTTQCLLVYNIRIKNTQMNFVVTGFGSV